MLRRVCGLGILLWWLVCPAQTRADAPIFHTVAWGETLSSLARAYGTTPQAIANANGLHADDWLYAGTRLKIPVGNANADALSPSGYYTVRAGDTLSALAKRFGTSVDALAAANDLPTNGLIYVGWSLKIPRAPTYRISATHIVQPGEYLSRIALRYGTTPQAIAFANDLPMDWMVYAGQKLNIPMAHADAAPIAAPNEIRVANVPLIRQKQPLTCEEASAAMATRGTIQEEQLLAVMPRSDNPFVGIRGATNSPTYGGLTNYGVYAQGLQKGLAALRIKSQVLYGQKYDEFRDAVLAHLRAGRPVIWWHTWRARHQEPAHVRVADGSLVKLVPYEHAGVIVAASERGVTYHDPYDASVRSVRWTDFQRVSAYFDYMALVILP